MGWLSPLSYFPSTTTFSSHIVPCFQLLKCGRQDGKVGEHNSNNDGFFLVYDTYNELITNWYSALQSNKYITGVPLGLSLNGWFFIVFHILSMFFYSEVSTACWRGMKIWPWIPRWWPSSRWAKSPWRPRAGTLNESGKLTSPCLKKESPLTPYGSKHCLRKYLSLQSIVNYTPNTF